MYLRTTQTYSPTGCSKHLLENPSSELRWPGDSQCESGRFARIDSHESIRRKTPIFIACERFARIASNLRFAVLAPRSAIRKRNGISSGTLIRNDSRESGDSRESANRFARIWPSKLLRNPSENPFSPSKPHYKTPSKNPSENLLQRASHNPSKSEPPPFSETFFRGACCCTTPLVCTLFVDLLTCLGKKPRERRGKKVQEHKAMAQTIKFHVSSWRQGPKHATSLDAIILRIPCIFI